MNSKPESWGVVQSPTAECVCFPKAEPVSIMMMSARLHKGLPCSSSHSSFGGKADCEIVKSILEKSIFVESMLQSLQIDDV